MDSPAHPLPHGLSWSSLLCSVRFPRDIPFFSPTGVLVNLNCVLSSIRVVSSTRSCSIRAKRILSHTPAFVHSRNRLYTLCHGPKRSGKSRHGIPVFSRYNIAFSISRLLFPGRPPCAFLSGGKRALILFHCFSPISCPYSTILSFCLQYLGFKTDSRGSRSTGNQRTCYNENYLWPQKDGVTLGHAVFLRQIVTCYY